MLYADGQFLQVDKLDLVPHWNMWEIRNDPALQEFCEPDSHRMLGTGRVIDLNQLSDTIAKRGGIGPAVDQPLFAEAPPTRYADFTR